MSAPLAGALLYISQSRDVLMGGSALFAMACGMSVPLMLLGASSGRWLPKSGPWMTAVKHLFGVLMLGVAIWTVQPVLPSPAVLALWGLLLLTSGFMLVRSPQRRRITTRCAAACRGRWVWPH